MACIDDGGDLNANALPPLLFRHYCKITLIQDIFQVQHVDVFSQTVDKATMAPAPRVRGLALN